MGQVIQVGPIAAVVSSCSFFLDTIVAASCAVLGGEIPWCLFGLCLNFMTKSLVLGSQYVRLNDSYSRRSYYDVVIIQTAKDYYNSIFGLENVIITSL